MTSMTPPTDNGTRYGTALQVLGLLMVDDLPLLAIASIHYGRIDLQVEVKWIKDDWCYRVDDEATRRAIQVWADELGFPLVETRAAPDAQMVRFTAEGRFLDFPVHLYTGIGQTSCTSCPGQQVDRRTGVCPDCGHEHGPAPEYRQPEAESTLPPRADMFVRCSDGTLTESTQVLS